MVKNIFTRLGIDKIATNEIEKFYSKGMEYLDRVKLAENNKEILRDVASKMVERDK